MTDRRSYRHHFHQHELRRNFEDRCRTLEEELQRKNDSIDSIRNDLALSNQPADLSRSTCLPAEQSFVRQGSQRSSVSSNWNSLTKDREIAKLKAIIFQKDSELIALTSANKNAILQMEDRMERERKVWNEHKERSIAGERVKFEEEKTRLLQELQDQVKLEQERCQRLEKKLYDTQIQSSEAQLMLKESGRERINAVYGTKEQCRKEFQDEISRLRNQFQLEKEAEFGRVQDRIRELEETLDQVNNDNADDNVRKHELFLNLETAEKTCVRSINDLIKKLHMAMESPSPIYATIPHVSSYTYDRDSLIERLPTRSALKLLQDAIDEVRNYILEQRVQIEAKGKILKKSKVFNDRTTDFSNRDFDDETDRHEFSSRTTSNLRQQKVTNSKENDRYFRDVDRLSQTTENDRRRSYKLSTRQNDTIDNLVQKLEDHIATELDRLTKQRLTLNGSAHVDDSTVSIHIEPPKKVKFELVPSGTTTTTNSVDESHQDSIIRHLQDRMSDLREDNMRLRDHQKSRTLHSNNNATTTSTSSNNTRSTFPEVDDRLSFTSFRSQNPPTSTS